MVGLIMYKETPPGFRTDAWIATFDSHHTVQGNRSRASKAICCLGLLLTFESGLRSRIDPEQIPSPIGVAEEDQALWSGQSYMTCTSQQPVPLSGSDYHAIDQG